MKSRVHPSYKTKYRVANWPTYDRALVRRGDVTVWMSPAAIAAWQPAKGGARGGQRRYSDLAIETAVTVRLVFHLPLRQTEGFLNAIFALMRIDRSAPDHTTLSRRSQGLDPVLARRSMRSGVHLLIDSSGLSLVGEGEWATAKHGGRGPRGWRKLHLGVDTSGLILAQVLTGAHVDDATVGIALMGDVAGPVARVTADGAYDTLAFYEAGRRRGATVVVPPIKTATVSRREPRSTARHRTIRAMQRIGRPRWKRASGYHRQARVENAFFRYKALIGEALRARSPGGQRAETRIACAILNRMTDLGRPRSYAVGR
jgi:IS5 family transposase